MYLDAKHLFFSCALLGSFFGSPSSILARGQWAQGGGGSGGGGTGGVPIGQIIPGPDRPGSFGRTACGDFDGDQLADVAMIRGGILEYVSDPGAYGVWFWSAREVHDLATLPRTSAQAAGSADVLVAIGPAGLTYHANIAAGDLDGDVIASGPGWNDGILVDSADAGDMGAPRIVAVLQDRRSLRQLRDNGTGYVSEDITLSLPLPQDAVDLALVDFDGGAPEIVIATENSLLVYSLGGVSLSSISFPGYTTTGFCAGVQGSGAEWVAWSSISSNGTEYLLIEDGTGLRPLTVLGSALGVVGIDALPWNSDGSDDLVLHVSGQGELWTLLNQGGTQPRFGSSAAGAGVITYGSTAQEMAIPASVDIDLDGDVDLLLPIQGSGGLGVERNASTAEQTQMVSIGTMLDGLSDPCLVAKGVFANSNTLNLDVSLTLPSIPPGATNLEVTVWKQTSSASNLTPQAVWSGDWDLANLSTGSLITIELPDPDLLVPNPQPETTQIVEFSNLYYIEFQLVDRSGGGSIRVQPPQIYGIQTESYQDPCECMNQAYLVGIQVVGSETIVVTTLYGVADPEYVGTLNQVPTLPMLIPGVPLVK